MKTIILIIAILGLFASCGRDQEDRNFNQSLYSQQFGTQQYQQQYQQYQQQYQQQIQQLSQQCQEMGYYTAVWSGNMPTCPIGGYPHPYMQYYCMCQ